MRQENLKLKPISEQVIVITGASSGIGLATAEMAAKKGAKLVLASRNKADLDKIAADFRDKNYEAIAVEADVANYEQMVHLANTAVETFGGLDTWVNNAGVTIYGPLLEVPLEEEKRIFDVNFWGVRHGCRVAAPILAKKGGAIINIGSEASERAYPIQGIYSATKHAVKAYTESLRMDFEKMNIPIAVTLIRPTAIDTPYTEHAVSHLVTGSPSLPPPVYHPNIVAKAILEAAENPTRDIYVGGKSRMTKLMNDLMPRTLDFVMEKTAYQSQSKGTKKPHLKQYEALMHPPPKEGRIRGDHNGRVSRISLYDTVNRHPLLSLAVTGLVAVGIKQALKPSTYKRSQTYKKPSPHKTKSLKH